MFGPQGARLALLVLCGAAGPAADAAEGSVLLSTGFGATDNVALVASDPQSSAFVDVTLGADVVHEGSRHAAGATGVLSYQETLSGEAEADVLGQMSGTFQYQILPGRVLWKARDDLSQYRVNPLAADAPGNRSLLNNFETGPELTIRLGQRNSLAISGTYGWTWDEQDVIGSREYLASAALARQLGTNQSLSLAASYQKLDFEQGGPGLVSRNLDLIYSLGGSRTGLTLLAGRTELRDFLGTKATMRGSLHGTRRVTPRLTLSVAFDYSLSNPLASLREVTDATQPGDNALIIATRDAFRNRAGRASVEYSAARTRLVMLARYSSPQYRAQPQFNRRFFEVGGRVTRSMGSRSTLEVKASWLRAQYKVASLDNDEGILSAGWQLQVGRRMFLRLDGQHAFRSRPDNLNEYTENRLLLSVGVGAGSGI